MPAQPLQSSPFSPSISHPENARNRLNEITHKHLFLRSLVRGIGFLDYGFMIPSGISLTEIGKLDQWHILVSPTDRHDLEMLLRNSPYISACKVRRKGGWSFLKLVFLDKSSLELILTERLCIRQHAFLNAKDVLHNSFINRDGLKLVKSQHSFEYHWMRCNEQRVGFPEKLKLFYFLKPTQEQHMIAQYICQKYRLAYRRLGQLISQSPGFSHYLLKKTWGVSN